MTVPRWLVPVLAIVAAVGVAVAATLVGARFAPAETVLSTPGSAVVPVLAPIGEGAELPASATSDPEGPDAEESPLVSEATGEREVTLASGDPAAADRAVLTLLGTLAEWPDGLFGLINLEGEAREGGDDPCAPREGESASGCPEGLRSTILSTMALRDFTAGGQAFPPTRAEYAERGNPYGGILWCDGLEPAAGEVPFGILATAPGRFTVRYWPTAAPGDEREATVETTPAQLAAWEEQVALPDGLPIVQLCFVIDGIEADTAYTAEVTGGDVFDRLSPGHTLRFHSGGRPTHPGIQLTPVGDNLLFASGLHTRDETLDLRAYLVPPDAVPTCDAPAGATQLTSLTETDISVGPDEVNALGAPPDFDRKAVRTFVIPEGATAIVCGRWFPGGGAPSWESAQATFESSAVVQAADRVLPSISLFDVTPYDDAVERVEVRVASAEGIECWQWAWTRDVDDTLPVELCDATLFSGGGTGADGGRLWTRGFSGDLVVTATTRLSTGESSETRYLIPAADGACRGICEPPARQWYRVALEDIRQGTGLCGSSFGADCTPPSREIAAGTATFFVDWEQGLSSGAGGWNITPTLDAPRDYVAPDAPQLDWDEYWSFSEPTLAVPWSTAVADLRVDRPVAYTLRFRAGADVATRCDGSGPLSATGVSVASGGENVLRLGMPGLCLGATYVAELELVAEDGTRSVWSLDRAFSWWGGMALVVAPALEAEVFYEVRAQSTSFSYLRVFGLDINGGSTRAVETRSGRCLEDGLIFSSGSTRMTVLNSNTVTLAMLVGEATRWGDAEAWGADCLSVPTDETARVATAEVDLRALFTPEGVVVRVPDLYGATVTLRARLVED
jgi:hypothetical protein